MTDPHSEIYEGFDQALRTMLMAAAKIRERVAERHMQRAQQQQHQAQQTQQHAAGSTKSQHKMLEAELAPVRDRTWWDQARPEQIAHKWELSTRFSEQNTRAQGARQTMRSTMQNRYGIDPETIQHDGRDLTSAVAALTAEEKQATAAQRGQRSAHRDEHEQRDATAANALSGEHADEDRTPKIYANNHEMLRQEVSPVEYQDWWDHATPSDIAGRWELADRFSGHSELANQYRDTMQSTFQTRYGHDLADVRHDQRTPGQAVAALLGDETQANSYADSLHAQQRDQQAAGGEDRYQADGHQQTAGTAEAVHQPETAATIAGTARDERARADSHERQATQLGDAAGAAETTAHATHEHATRADSARQPQAANSGYQRARASDMSQLASDTQTNRVAAGESFPQPRNTVGQQQPQRGTSQQTARTQRQQHPRARSR